MCVHVKHAVVLAAWLIFAGMAAARQGDPRAASAQPQQPAGPQMRAPASAFDEAWLVIRSAFYDPNLKGVDWPAVREELGPKFDAAKTATERSAVINEALSRLHASHTHHYIQDQREYYELLDIFYPDGVPERKLSTIIPGSVEYVGIGMATQVIDGHFFAHDVYDGGPADNAGIKTGDELIAVEGEPWGPLSDVAPFRGRENKPTQITIQPTKDSASRKDITVTPILIHPREMFIKAIQESAQFIERDGRKVAYVRIRSYAHIAYQDTLKEVLRTKFGSASLPTTAIPLIIDLRGGWGGASPSYMDIFNPTAPTLTFTSREGHSQLVQPSWKGPVAMLIDEGSRSGKEVLAYAFKKHHVGILVGHKTAGMVLAGICRPLADGSVLYLAVQNVLVDGESLEGVGVEPDVKVERNLPYSEGKDKQVEAAVRALLSMGK